ncbi:hypothetical protein DSM106972_023440 [Dulcicalothrix desertica PCC 7102]|uniref:DUF4253 domain-containing protein n=1 Tax=Dulcicalothrix desertica PCC 7102 TaxID=232991 RepID=A0A3S1CN43_9CYAN|nr:ankyrin repeat domain-containing protein [Dulcicalothrix desertica]RUT07083.1 hypothetical protein DSM106972_023440 [Dulcicalothrix desertica PCC 7102]TWH61920.1 ankyrin repeat protein [Dulcicalothrix desertica PCC 7102]
MDEQLIAAIESGDIQRVRELLEAGANPNAKKGGNTAYQLVPHGRDDIKCTLIEAGANDASLRHSLVWAVGTRRVETVKALIQRGANVNMASVGLGSPLQSAAREGSLEIVDVLIAAGADVDDGNSISTPLLTAIEEGHFDIALKLINNGANPNQTATYAKVPPIGIAAVQGSPSVIRALLAAGADVNALINQITINQAKIRNSTGAALKSAFEMLETAGKAIEKLDAVETETSLSEVNEVVESVDIAANRAKLSSNNIPQPENAVDTFPVILAARCGHAEALTVLMEAGADPYCKDGEGLSAYEWAGRNEHSRILEVLRRFGVDGTRVDKNENLILAAEQGDVATVSEWLTQGADINARDQRRKTKNSTPLMLAAACGHIEVVEALLQAGANPNLSDVGDETAKTPLTLFGQFKPETIAAIGYRLGRTPLILAVNNLAILQRLLSGGAELNTQDALGYTALHLACQDGSVEVVRELINAGADVNITNHYKETILFRPAQKCNLELIKLLIETDVDVNAVSSSGETALALVAGATCNITAQVLEAVEFLIAAGADPNLPNCSMTPLAQAASQGYLSVMQRLLDAGTRIELCTNNGYTAFDMADLYGREEALEFLEQRAGDFSWKSRWNSDDSYNEDNKNDEDDENEEDDEDKGWDIELAQPDFTEAAKNPEYQKAVAELGEICGSQPVPMYDDFPGYFQVHVNTKRRRDIKTEQLQQQFLQCGCFVYEPNKYFDGEGPKKLCILPTTNKYDVIALHQTNGCNYGISPSSVVQWLRELEAEQPFILTLIAHDTLEGRFLTPIKDPEELATRMYDFCSDIVDQGCGSVENLVERLRSSDYLYFWWD